MVLITCEFCKKIFECSNWNAKRGQKYCSKACFGSAYSAKKGTIEQRFWNQVNKNGPTMPHMTTPCWEWTGFTNKKGYARFQMKPGKFITIHRFSYQAFFGKIQSDKIICHHCDNPSCVNPEHLYMGTYKDNAIDRETRNRANHPRGTRHGSYTKPESVPRGERNGRKTKPDNFPKGSSHPNSVLKEYQVKEIFHLRFNEKLGIKKIAKKYNVGYTTIWNIVNKNTWKHLS